MGALLQLHPLALIQAGAYISQGHCQLGQYPVVYKRQWKRLLQFQPAQAQSRYCNMYAMFKASAAVLKQSMVTIAGDALELLPLLAVCGASQLPIAVFQAGWNGARDVSPEMAEEIEDKEVALLTPWHVSWLPALLDIDEEVWDSYRLVKAIQLLKAFTLVSTEGVNESMMVSMHPLVHTWARDQQTTGEQYTHWLSMGCMMALIHTVGLSYMLNWLLQAHIESVVE